eukprot:TRINITY_DN67063_c2_g9_i1.p1 TRINITY_DN67063_c2_g9~~TRINITY_DN67063_c2_g9_i1.p1  ORF type:complete len:185 (-),score=10.22 TRINITY_DN67063_c2_g9_i1:239-793(-)
MYGHPAYATAGAPYAGYAGTYGQGAEYLPPSPQHTAYGIPMGPYDEYGSPYRAPPRATRRGSYGGYEERPYGYEDKFMLALLVFVAGCFIPIIWCAGALFVSKRYNSRTRALGILSLVLFCCGLLAIIITFALVGALVWAASDDDDGNCGDRSNVLSCGLQSGCSWCHDDDDVLTATGNCRTSC